MNINYKKKVMQTISNYCESNYNIINKNDMILGTLLMNRKCHFNSVQVVKEGKCKKVYLCIAINKNDVFVHFINQNFDDKYLDNTLGWTYDNYTYYIIREVNENEYSVIESLLIETKKNLVYLHSNWFLRFIYRFDENII